MFSFGKIATIATIAFGALAAALPSPAPANELVTRQSDDVTSILNNLSTDLQGPAGQLSEPY